MANYAPAEPYRRSPNVQQRSSKLARRFRHDTMKAHLQNLLREAAIAAFGEAAAPASIAIDATKDAKHGDFASNVALVLAKPVGKPPRAVAETLVKHLPASSQVAKVE